MVRRATVFECPDIEWNFENCAISFRYSQIKILSIKQGCHRLPRRRKARAVRPNGNITSPAAGEHCSKIRTSSRFLSSINGPPEINEADVSESLSARRFSPLTLPHVVALNRRIVPSRRLPPTPESILTSLAESGKRWGSSSAAAVGCPRANRRAACQPAHREDISRELLLYMYTEQPSRDVRRRTPFPHFDFILLFLSCVRQLVT